MKHQSLKQRYSTQFTGEWEYVPTINEYGGPSARCGHTLTIHGTISDNMSCLNNNNNNNNNNKQIKNNNIHGKLLVTFGESSLLSSREYLDDMYILDLDTLKWIKILGKDILPEYKPYIKSNFNPVARADHSAVPFGTNSDRCLIFGGKCKDTYLDDLILIKNINAFDVNSNEYLNDELIIESIHLPKGPCARRGSSLCPWKEGSFLLFGGQRGPLFFNDLWGLDLHKQGWVELATRRNPIQRAFHSAFVDSQQQMLLLGGVRDTNANPAPADIYKLDLRAGKFFKLGDKHMVPGIGNALSKGHHSSHFLSKNCDLIIFAPQKASTYVLGGNVTSEHCGRCTQIKILNNNNNINKPFGTCRSATALLESHNTIPNFKSIGCDNILLERLFMFGGYSPIKRICTNKLYSLKFSSQPCKILDHKCIFTPTSILKNIKKSETETIETAKSEIIVISETEIAKEKEKEKEKEEQQEQEQEQEQEEEEEEEQQQRVSIVQTPVRTKSLPRIYNYCTFSMFESEAANHKITCLDPDLEDINLENMNNKYNPIHLQFIERVLLNFDESLLDPESSFLLEPHEIISIIHIALPLIQNDSTLIRINGPVKIFGDIHGQLGDLISLFKSFGYPDKNIGDILFYKYIFLGDFVDRGHKSLEIMCLLLSLKIEYPNRIYLIRGNHECHAMNEMYGFYQEINDRLYPNINTIKYLENGILNTNITNNKKLLNEMEKELKNYNNNCDNNINNNNNNDEFIFNIKLEYDNKKKIYKSRKYFNDRSDCLNYLVQSFELLFRWLPLSILISNRILCVHGGIGEIEYIEQIENIQRPCDVICDIQQEMDQQQKKVVDLLWSDPAEKDDEIGFQPNKRGVSCVFGSDVVRKFCKINDIDLIIRGHQVVKDGFEYFAGGHLITVFSATNYCNVMDNAGAILCIDNKLRVLPKLVEPRQINNNNYQILSNNNNNNTSSDDNNNDDNNSDDNLQWRKLKQFPPSPMRNSNNKNNNNNNDNNNNNNNNNNNEIQLTFDDIVSNNNDNEILQQDEQFFSNPSFS